MTHFEAHNIRTGKACLYRMAMSILSPAFHLFCALGPAQDLRAVPREVYFIFFPSNGLLWRGLNLVP